jgi:hypothetical protein
LEARKVSDRTILTTGIIAWLMLAFASVKLAVIYAKNPSLAYLLTYNISSFVFLVYFIGYFKERFGIAYLLLLLISFNTGINALHFLYNRLFLLEPPPAEFERAIASSIVNAVMMFVTWGLLYWFIRRKR